MRGGGIEGKRGWKKEKGMTGWGEKELREE